MEEWWKIPLLISLTLGCLLLIAEFLKGTPRLNLPSLLSKDQKSFNITLPSLITEKSIPIQQVLCSKLYEQNLTKITEGNISCIKWIEKEKSCICIEPID